MVINFALTQFVPGGPIEQIIANFEGNGDVFEGIAGGSKEVAQNFEQNDRYTGARGLPPEFIAELEKELDDAVAGKDHDLQLALSEAEELAYLELDVANILND